MAIPACEQNAVTGAAYNIPRGDKSATPVSPRCSVWSEVRFRSGLMSATWRHRPSSSTCGQSMHSHRWVSNARSSNGHFKLEEYKLQAPGLLAVFVLVCAIHSTCTKAWPLYTHGAHTVSLDKQLSGSRSWSWSQKASESAARLARGRKNDKSTISEIQFILSVSSLSSSVLMRKETSAIWWPYKFQPPRLCQAWVG